MANIINTTVQKEEITCPECNHEFVAEIEVDIYEPTVSVNINVR